MADRGGPSIGFTREARQRLNAIRAVTYSLAFLFMFAMGMQGVWVTQGQMEAGAERSVHSAEAAVAGVVQGSGQVDTVRIGALLSANSAEGVAFGIADREGRPVVGLPSLPPGTEFRRADLGQDGLELRAAIDRAAIWRAALGANIASILFILALGIPTLASFFYLRRMVNRPAFALLDYAQAGLSTPPPTDMPEIWTRVIDRLTELKNTQAQLQAFLDHAPIGMSHFDPAGRLTMMNRYGARYFGESADDLVGRNLADFTAFFPAAPDQAASLLQNSLTQGRTATVETEFNAPTGETLIFRITSFPILGAQGEVDLIGAFFFDVTEQRRAEADLEQSRALFEAFVQNAPNPMALIDTKGHRMRYIMVNDAIARYYDMTPEALLAAGPRHIHAHFPEAKSVIAPLLGRVMTTLQSEQVDTPFEMPSGEIRDMAFSYFPILDAQGALAFIGNIAHDVTEERRVQNDLAASRESLHQAEKLAALGSMLAGVSHELNNPLAAVIGQAALLGEDLEGTPHADRIAKIRRAADRCARIVQSFLAMARQKAPEYRPVRLNDQVRGAIELTEYHMRAVNIAIDLDLQPDLPTLEADPDQLHQVIVNLLTNARQALETVEGDRRIAITSRYNRDAVILTVSDNGPGVEPGARQRIFDPFFTTKAVGAGTGIGLSYSLGIVEAHGGTITIEDSAIGTRFVVTLPVRDEGAVDSCAEPAGDARGRGRVLVIDDEEDVAETLADMLERMGLDVSVAIGGVAGRKALARGARFDLILSDIRMPDMDGPALYAWVAAERPELVGAVAFVTGDTMSNHVAGFLADTRCPVLEKPFTPASLGALVEGMMNTGVGEPK
ncbi:hybrid sensor histidine kinase/response regulator [Sphingopyxis sp.]|uniref:hybrid sensor histidine kinase/response regulator n=1 Tax=Sphingopyxis sp. TaxID=1908224 RepID=UPI003D12F318